MDKQLALMKRYQKDDNTIAYVHNGEIVLIKRVETELVEIILDSTTESQISKRMLAPTEMTLMQFEAMKKALTDSTIEKFNAEQRQTYRNVSYDLICNIEKLSEPSVEAEVIFDMFNEYHNPDDIEYIYELVRAAKLTKPQMRRFIEHYFYKKTIVSVAREEGVGHNSVACSLKLAKNKLKKYFSKARDEHTYRLKNLCKYYLNRYISRRKKKE